MGDRNAPGPDVQIDAMTVRARGLSVASGRELATAVAKALVGSGGTVTAHIDHLTLRLPASVMTPDGTIDRTVIVAALNRPGSAFDA